MECSRFNGVRGFVGVCSCLLVYVVCVVDVVSCVLVVV